MTPPRNSPPNSPPNSPSHFPAKTAHRTARRKGAVNWREENLQRYDQVRNHHRKEKYRSHFRDSEIFARRDAREVLSPDASLKRTGPHVDRKPMLWVPTEDGVQGVALQPSEEPVGGATPAVFSPALPSDIGGPLKDWYDKPLFSGIDDVIQNGVADCYFLAVLAGALFMRPGLLPQKVAKSATSRMISGNFCRGTDIVVRVDGQLSASKALPNRATGAMGVSILEKMYAFARTFYSSGAMSTTPSQNSYSSLNYGSPSAVMRDLRIAYTFVSAQSTSLVTAVMAALSRGQIIAANTVRTPPANVPIVAYHIYTLIGLQKTTAGWQFILNNPWNADGPTPNPDGNNDGVITLTESQFRAVFGTVVISQLP